MVSTFQLTRSGRLSLTNRKERKGTEREGRHEKIRSDRGQALTPGRDDRSPYRCLRFPFRVFRPFRGQISFPTAGFANSRPGYYNPTTSKLS